VLHYVRLHYLFSPINPIVMLSPLQGPCTVRLNLWYGLRHQWRRETH